MSMPAFYIPPEQWGASLALENQEASHVHVLRLKDGDEVLALDGAGKSAVCRIAGISRKKVALDIASESFTPMPESRAVMAIALSKAARRGFFFEKASEFGASEIWLWQADHSQGKISAGMAENCQGQLVAGCKQCHNPWLPLIRVQSGIGELLERAGSADWRILPWESQNGVPMLTPDLAGRKGVSVYVIGPEGGFSEAELASLEKADFQAVSLGGRILRCETAAVLCLGLHWWASQLLGHPDCRQRESRPC